LAYRISLRSAYKRDCNRRICSYWSRRPSAAAIPHSVVAPMIRRLPASFNMPVRPAIPPGTKGSPSRHICPVPGQLVFDFPPVHTAQSCPFGPAAAAVAFASVPPWIRHGPSPESSIRSAWHIPWHVHPPGCRSHLPLSPPAPWTGSASSSLRLWGSHPEYRYASPDDSAPRRASSHQARNARPRPPPSFRKSRHFHLKSDGSDPGEALFSHISEVIPEVYGRFPFPAQDKERSGPHTPAPHETFSH